MTKPRPTDACALVTGGSRGIGAATALALAEDGWPVVVNYRSDADGAGRTVAAIEAAGGRAVALRGDIAEQPGDVLEEAERELGPVLALVNNAGVRADNLALSISDEDWDRVLRTNLTAAFRLTRGALRAMIRARFGRVISIASIVGPRANAGQANYAASKAGLIAMSNTVAVEVARRGVTVNTVAPGFIATDMTADLAEGVIEAVPARRPGTPEEVAACVRFLASEAASYVTASTVYVDGGLAA
ncbi:MAG: 3-oxoacyl-[acyl-carrier protein] reductase [Solirubrobacteraceae bacterium]|jgi:3-oxoacyl-[acyl-carrier protein] reductase|nr:3-oxoacyl-[acyl-carrier protein] reductase [Solirubrobacteraceae bacterium]